MPGRDAQKTPVSQTERERATKCIANSKHKPTAMASAFPSVVQVCFLSWKAVRVCCLVEQSTFVTL